MIFSTYKFILLFLPIVWLSYFVCNKLGLHTLAKLVLVIASLFFYAQGSADFFPMFVFSIVFNYIIGTAIVSKSLKGRICLDISFKTISEKKVLFYIGILANVGLLGYYKYTDFFISNLNTVFGAQYTLQHIVLPIGISFFTFQLIAYLVDCYRGETKEYDFINYLLFITFFPQLIVGPIVHHSEMVPQFEDKYNSNIDYNNISKGLFLFSIGCAKKILLADVLTPDAQIFFENITEDISFLEAWFFSIEYTISYYFDLSGYADMAIGIGLMFNIVIPHNFDSPYRTRNFQEYWRRWHMTLSRFLGQYIFKNVYRKDVKYRNYYVATMVTFLVSGFWHGAGWNFVLWGIINGIFVCSASWMKQRNLSFPFIVSFLLTAIGVVMLRAMFVAESFTDIMYVYEAMLDVSSLWNNGIEGIVEMIKSLADISTKQCAFTLLLGICICLFVPKNSKALAEEFKPTINSLCFALVLMGLCLMNMNKVEVFLYFQF